MCKQIPPAVPPIHAEVGTIVFFKDLAEGYKKTPSSFCIPLGYKKKLGRILGPFLGRSRLQLN